MEKFGDWWTNTGKQPWITVSHASDSGTGCDLCTARHQISASPGRFRRFHAIPDFSGEVGSRGRNRPFMVPVRPPKEANHHQLIRIEQVPGPFGPSSWRGSGRGVRGVAAVLYVDRHGCPKPFHCNKGQRPTSCRRHASGVTGGRCNGGGLAVYGAEYPDVCAWSNVAIAAARGGRPLPGGAGAP